MAPTANSAGIPTLQGFEDTPAAAWRDEPGTLRVVFGFGSDSNDRIIGTIKLAPRSRPSDDVWALIGAAAGAGQVEVTDPVYSNADQRVPTDEKILLNVAQVRWVARWADFGRAHRMADEASRS